MTATTTRINIIQCINKFFHSLESGVKYSKNSFVLRCVSLPMPMQCDACNQFLHLCIFLVCTFNAELWQCVASYTSHNLEYEIEAKRKIWVHLIAVCARKRRNKLPHGRRSHRSDKINWLRILLCMLYDLRTINNNLFISLYKLLWFLLDGKRFFSPSEL